MSLTNFSAIDLSQFPTPDLIEPLSFEDIKRAIVEDYQQRFPDAQLNYVSDPVIKLIETFAYRELLIRQRINEGAEAVLLAKASGEELDFLGQRFGVTRAVLASQPTDEAEGKLIKESDERFRTRIKLALEGFSTAGPTGAYAYHCFKASSHIQDVFIEAPEFVMQLPPDELVGSLPAGTMLLQNTYDAGLEQPVPGDVAITLLSDETDGTPSEQVLATVLAALNQDDVRPLTDRINLLKPAIKTFTIKAKLHLYPGFNSDDVYQAVYAECENWLKQRQKFGHDISLSGLYAVLHGAGVQRVELQSPSADIFVADKEVAHCQSIEIGVEAQRDV
ncbi:MULTISPECIES: baseplate assembly protein [Pseudoalteromonas]|uniref:Baseplate protein n=1 Tax=Pseudoalteromonas amylolytica TaxID=1859457 RepID=A0A1S1MW68_9GAMM|nr:MULTISPECIES: baseplate J/gp47 family protein [Pseudoalteromonas]OHU87813.1 baseplate protein [Pseudoalteromonas sp. JW3]OHU91253.1 baseplate protein [Pseudoalteromonas amylolytica]